MLMLLHCYNYYYYFFKTLHWYKQLSIKKEIITIIQPKLKGICNMHLEFKIFVINTLYSSMLPQLFLQCLPQRLNYR